MNLQELYIKILETNTLNFIIMVLILGLIYKKCKLALMFDDMQNNISDKVRKSQLAVQKAIEEYKTARKNSRNKDSIKENITKEANETIEKLKLKNKESLEQKKEELEEQYEKNKVFYIENKVQKTADEIKDVVLELSKEIIEEKMNPETQRKVILDCLKELDNIEEVRL